MHLLLDADIFLYRVGFTTEGIDPRLAVARLDQTIDKIREDLQSSEYTCFLSPQGKKSFRYELYPDYKAGRTKPKPEHYDLLRGHIISQHPSEIAYNEEADDAIGREATLRSHSYWDAVDSRIVPSMDEAVVVSIDKDLDQIPGSHYNFVKETEYKVTEIDAIRYFYKQILMGDSADNVPGCPKIGPVKADKLINFLDTEEEMYRTVVISYLAAYKDATPEDVDRMVELTANVLWIRKHGREEWHPPK